eukprot:TRINITY_DN6487_c0_g1_i1.p1 TRINITY_DN6487_c0_g1~~TRINITY_DN6487_c0_g1_i1.p1  ORF type:complete len:280 (+),score=47.42 TRINITY_DN6487_c0_g1_i1:3-842(+)
MNVNIKGFQTLQSVCAGLPRQPLAPSAGLARASDFFGGGTEWAGQVFPFTFSAPLERAPSAADVEPDIVPEADEGADAAEPEARAPRLLFYYMRNLQTVIDAVLSRHSHLLSLTQRQLLSALWRLQPIAPEVPVQPPWFVKPAFLLSESATRLFVRLYLRKGPWFRVDALEGRYSEITGSAAAAVAELCSAGFLVKLERSADWRDNLQIMLALETVEELRGLASDTGGTGAASSAQGTGFSRSRLLASLQQQRTIDGRAPPLVQRLAEVWRVCECAVVR